MAADSKGFPDVVIGETLGGRYRVDALIGVGGMGAVFAAVHKGTGRRVAIKLLVPELREHPKAIIRFQLEAQSAASTNRRGVVDVLDYDVDPRRGHYLVMELLEGESLYARIGRRRRLLPVEALNIAIEILETLAAVHAQDIVHRDLKPANIFLARTEDGGEIVKILDFGISRFNAIEQKTQLTTPGMAVGTPRYMAPEQAACDPDVDGRADLYSVGAILYEALSGTKPYDNLFPGRILAEVILRSPVPLREIAPSLAPGLLAAIERAMERDRRSRYETAEQMLAALTPLRDRLIAASDEDAETVVDMPVLRLPVEGSEGPSALDEPAPPRRDRFRPREDLPSWPVSGSQPGRDRPSPPSPARIPETRDTRAPGRAEGASEPRGPATPLKPARPRRALWAILIVAALLLVGAVLALAIFFGEPLLTATAESPPAAPTAPAPAPPPASPPVSSLLPAATAVPGASTAPSPAVSPLRQDLDDARRAQIAGMDNVAEQRLNRLIAAALAQGAAPETAPGRVLAEAHLLLSDIHINRINRPPRPGSDREYLEMRPGLTGPFSAANHHANQAPRYSQSLTQCAMIHNARAAERIGEVHLEIYQSTSYRAELSGAISALIERSAREHLGTALQFYESALARPTTGVDDCSAQAAAGRERVDELLHSLPP